MTAGCRGADEERERTVMGRKEKRERRCRR
jgi:hypothetical protein